MEKNMGDNDESVEISGGRGGREQQRSWKRSIRGGRGGRERLRWKRSAAVVAAIGAEEAEIGG